MKVCLGQVYLICFIGHRIDFCAGLTLRIQLGGWLYKPEVSFSQKRSQRVLFWYWQYCEGVLFKAVLIRDSTALMLMISTQSKTSMNSFSVGGQFERTAFCLV